jgi:chromosome segregation ATPase
MYDDFIDLRRANLSTDSFWPSFTDIMTVVVMIFLITSSLLMVRNWELIEQLRNSMMAEEKASEMIRNTSEENATLEEQLAQAQHEISMLRMQMMQASEQNSRLASNLDDKEKQIIIVLSENQQLQNELEENAQKIALLTSEFESASTDLAALRTNFNAQNEELKSTRDQIIILRQEKDNQNRELASLQDDFGSLKVKYDKLIKPARTAKGKYVVSVFHERKNDKTVIRFKDAGDQDYTTLGEKALYRKLDALKKKHGNKLYVKIVIPEKSGLTYSEAWDFMKNILDKYDYYYQGQ